MAPQTLNTTRDVTHPQIDARGGGNVNKTVIEISERTMSLIALILATMSIMTAVWMSRENDHLYRSIQELRIRVEDAENVVEKVNPNFFPHR